LIRNALDGLLTKAPILSKQIVGELVEDLEQASGILVNNKKLKAYLESKYFSRFNPEVEKAVFKALWKFVFRATDERCEKNRAINYSALSLLYGRNPIQFKAQIETDRDYFSTIATDGAPLVCLIYFLSLEAQIYGQLADHAKTAIHHAAENNVASRCLAWFTAPSLQEHAEQLQAWITGDDYPKIDCETWDAIGEISDSAEWTTTVVRLASAYYVASRNYDDADQRFNEAVRPLLPAFTRDNCLELIRCIETNGQTWERHGAYRDHRELRARALEIAPTLNLTEYQVFNRHLG
jgi:hypothetical protein